MIGTHPEGYGRLRKYPSPLGIGIFSGTTQLWHNLPEIFLGQWDTILSALLLISHVLHKQEIFLCYYMASSASGQDEPNRML